MVRGTDSWSVTTALKQISAGKRSEVKEVTLDLSPAMHRIVRMSFPGAVLVNDRFHVQKLFAEAMDDLRIKHRWEAMDAENAKIKEHRKNKTKYVPYEFENGDTRRQLLFRSRRLLLIHQCKWTDSQKKRASILFRLYPDIKEAYDRYLELVSIYNTRIAPDLSPDRKEYERARILTKLARWYDRIDKMKSKCFHIVPLWWSNRWRWKPGTGLLANSCLQTQYSGLQRDIFVGYLWAPHVLSHNRGTGKYSKNRTAQLCHSKTAISGKYSLSLMRNSFRLCWIR